MPIDQRKIIAWAAKLKLVGAQGVEEVAADLESSALSVSDRADNIQALGEALGNRGLMKTQADLTQHHMVRQEINNLLKPSGK